MTEQNCGIASWWRQLGKRCAMLDLQKAYLQVHVHPSLWTHQAAWWHNKVYLLTQLGFGLSSAPKVMTTIVEWILATNTTIVVGKWGFLAHVALNDPTPGKRVHSMTPPSEQLKEISQVALNDPSLRTA